MSETRNTQEILAEAERAANTGDFLSAEALLRDAAVRQEAELGPIHPDLANTVNNLAVAAEKSGRLEDAETFYRRAVAIASASLAPDDPKLAASRQNLEDFCRAHGRPIDAPRTIPPRADAPELSPPTPGPTLAPTPVPTLAPTPAPMPTPPPSLPRVSAQTSRNPPMLTIGVVGLIVAGIFIAWLWSPRRPSSAGPAAGPSQANAADHSPPPRPAGAAAAPHATPASPVHRPAAAAPAPASDAIQLVTVQLCRSFSTITFRCNPAGESVAAGKLVLLTRVRSPRDGVVVHRWYRGDSLRKSARLRIGANEAEGYRTFSQQSVDPGDWRVEVRSGSGELLYEHRLVVR